MGYDLSLPDAKLMFGLAVIRPEILFQVLGGTGWFALIDKDIIMQILLVGVPLLMTGHALQWWRVM